MLDILFACLFHYIYHIKQFQPNYYPIIFLLAIQKYVVAEPDVHNYYPSICLKFLDKLKRSNEA